VARLVLPLPAVHNRHGLLPSGKRKCSGVTLHRRTAPTAPCSATYEPGVTVIAQGRKRVDLGQTTFIYGESRYLLTSVDLPIVSQIIEASEEAPCLCDVAETRNARDSGTSQPGRDSGG
jgi:hypothetical protein